jgi:hypothetical protein
MPVASGFFGLAVALRLRGIKKHAYPLNEKTLQVFARNVAQPIVY